jgi:beta-phosphoglucomutase-like phosphatase (HAD superfamily)
LKIKALIFDVDGTLADTEEAHRESFNCAFQEHRLDWHWSRRDYARWLDVAGGKERLAAFIDTLPLADMPPLADPPPLASSGRDALKALIPAIHRTKCDHYAQLVRSGCVPLRAGIKRLLKEATVAGVQLAIASTTTRENIDALLEAHFGGRGNACFRVIGAGDAVEHKKPAPDIYRFVLRELGESAADCVALEDSSQGLVAAKRAGLFTVITPSDWTLGEDFSNADLLLSSWDSCDRPFLELEYAFATKLGRRPRYAAGREV